MKALFTKLISKTNTSILKSNESTIELFYNDIFDCDNRTEDSLIMEFEISFYQLTKHYDKIEPEEFFIINKIKKILHENDKLQVKVINNKISKVDYDKKFIYILEMAEDIQDDFFKIIRKYEYEKCK